MELVVLNWFGVFFGSEFWVRVWGVGVWDIGFDRVQAITAGAAHKREPYISFVHPSHNSP